MVIAGIVVAASDSTTLAIVKESVCALAVMTLKRQRKRNILVFIMDYQCNSSAKVIK